MRAAILTVSDRSAAGEREDQSGPVLEAVLNRMGWQVEQRQIVPDTVESIKEVLTNWVDESGVDLILTTGGTGLDPRDVTPEATEQVCQRMAPGIAEAMRAASLKITPHAMLSRAVAGIRGDTLIINLPGSPKGAKENLEVVLPALKHAIEVLQSSKHAEPGHQTASQRKQL